MKRSISLLLCLSVLISLLSSCAVRVEEEYEKKKEAVSTREPQKRDLDGKLVVMIDPGHGFGDVGTTSDYLGTYEKDINLSVSLKLKGELEKRGVEVILTHDGESFINENELIRQCDELGIEYKAEAVNENNTFYAYERALYAMVMDEKVGVDMFVSLHVNAVENGDISGYELFYCSDNPEADRINELCGEIAKELDAECDTKAYDKDNAYIVTKFGTFPSVLFEMGYATNKEDAEKLKNENFQNSLAEVLSEKIYESIKAVAK